MHARVNTQTRHSLPCSHTQSISSKRLEYLLRHKWVLNSSRHVDFKTKKVYRIRNKISPHEYWLSRVKSSRHVYLYIFKQKTCIEFGIKYHHMNIGCPSSYDK